MKRPIANSLRCLPVMAALTTLIASAAPAEPPVRIYLLVGQSNMQGKGAIEGEGNHTLRHIVENDANKEYQFLITEDGEWVEREDVWIYLDQVPRKSKFGGLEPGYGSSDGQIGPELSFGHKMGDDKEGPGARDQGLLGRHESGSQLPAAQCGQVSETPCAQRPRVSSIMKSCASWRM